MLAIPKTAVLHRDSAAPTQTSTERVVWNAARAGDAVVAISGAAEAQNLTTVAPEPVLWQRPMRRVNVDREPRRHYPPQRLSYFEKAATAREMDRL